jgi:serine/threonine protein kinase/tetratricopeptide (TPR) repeat protein
MGTSTQPTLDRYEIVELIGEGGMATVYRARQLRLERDVAVKVMLPELATDRTFRERFELEAQAIANLRHPNILTVHDYGESDDGQLYLVVEYVHGGALRDRLSSPPSVPPEGGEASPPVGGTEGGLSLQEAVEITAQVADALDYAHRQGVIHRDVKPNNILLTREGRPLLADFGLVKPIQGDRRLTASGVMLGTPDYVAPEQARSLEIDGRADIYSLGVMLFEMLTGQHPYTGETPISVIIKHISDPMPRPSSLNPEISPTLDEIVATATAKSPDERYQRAGDMARALRAALADPDATPAPQARVTPPPAAGPVSPVSAPFDQAHATPSPAPFLPPRPWYRRAWLWAVVALVVALAATGVLMLSPKNGAEEPAGGIPHAQPGETLILIARFKAQPGSAQFDISQRIHDKLATDLRPPGGAEILLYQIPQALESSDAALALGREHGATVVVWGYYDDLGISPYVETVGETGADVLSVGLERFNLSDSEEADFKLYVAQDLPQEVTFLTALALVQTFATQGSMDQTMTYLRVAADNLPADPRFRGGNEVVLFFQGMQAYFDANLTKAVELLDQAIVIESGRALFYVMRSLAYFQMEEAGLAMADLERAIDLEPDNVLAHTILGSAAWMMGDLQTAASAYQQLTRLNPDDMVGYFLLSWVSFELGDLDMALDALDGLEKIVPGNPLATSRGLVHEKRGQSQQAQTNYEWAVRIKDEVPPDFCGQIASQLAGEQASIPYAYLFECASYQAQGEIEQALAACDRALELYPGYFDALWKRGQLHAAQGRLQAAVDDYTAAIEVAPSYPWPYYLRAQAHIELGQTDEAQVDLAQALELEPVDELRQQIEALQQAAP